MTWWIDLHHNATIEVVQDKEAQFCIDVVIADVRKNTTLLDEYPNLEFRYLWENKVWFWLPWKDIRKVNRVENWKNHLIYQKSSVETNEFSLFIMLHSLYWETKDKNWIVHLYDITKEDAERALAEWYHKSYDKFITFEPKRKAEVDLNSADYIAAYETMALRESRDFLKKIFYEWKMNSDLANIFKTGIELWDFSLVDIKKLQEKNLLTWFTDEELADLYKIAKAKFKYQVWERRFYDYWQPFALEDIMKHKGEFSKQDFNEILRNFTKWHADEVARQKKRKEEEKRIIEEWVKKSLNKHVFQ